MRNILPRHEVGRIESKRKKGETIIHDFYKTFFHDHSLRLILASSDFFRMHINFNLANLSEVDNPYSVTSLHHTPINLVVRCLV